MKPFFTSVLLLLQISISAQLSGNLWLGGYNEFPGVPGNGQYLLRFSSGGTTVEQASLAFNFESTAAVAATADGQILFYSNGCSVANRQHQVMPNGGGLNPGSVYDQVCPWKGYIVPQGAMALPAPGRPNHYYLLHMGAVYEPYRKLRLGPLYYTEIDLSLQNGLGDVVTKNNVLLDADLGNFTAVRHGNGRDWWLLAPEFGNRRWHIFWVNPQGIQEMPPQQMSISDLHCEQHGQTAMSPDGNRVANWGDWKLSIFDFDRCAGLLSAPHEIAAHPHWFTGGGLAFSPSGRYLYSTDHNVLYRTDFESNFPQVDTMRFSYGFGNYDVPGNTFHQLINGPNGVIYGNIPSRAKYFHALKAPDAPGIDDIGFVPQSLTLPVTNVRTMPHFPNFQLYDLPGSPCDTLGINGNTRVLDVSGSPEFSMAPNPAHDLLQLGLPAGGLKNAQILLTDGTGKYLGLSDFNQAEHQVLIPIAQLPPGLYCLSIRTADLIWTGKFVKQ